jgi:transposase
MASRLLTDELWNEIEGFFPERPVSPLGGRPAADNRTVLTSILFVLKTGIAWEDLPLELGGRALACGNRCSSISSPSYASQADWNWPTS